MNKTSKLNNDIEKPLLLLVDDEDSFRNALKRQLSLRGYEVMDVASGEDAIKVVRHHKPEVVVLDQKMPKMDGIQTLKELKKIQPEVQVIMLTGYGSIPSARITGKHDAFGYMQKPCSIKELTERIEAAREERLYAMQRHEIPDVKRRTLRQWLIGAHNARPGFMILGLVFFTAIIATPSPQMLTDILSTRKRGQNDHLIRGYADYNNMKEGQSIAEYYSMKAGWYQKRLRADGSVEKLPLSPKQTAFKARVMIGVLVVAALFWATGAIPIGITAILVGVLMYFFGIFPPNLVAQAYAKDAVLFIFGILSIAAAMGKTGLDKRVGILLLGTSSSLGKLCLIFCPLLAVSASFLSEHALVAFLAPIFVLIYGGAVQAASIKKDRHLAVMLLLMLCYVANVGGPGSPAAGGRNAIMVGIMQEYGINITFGQWVMYGLPFVPVMALVIGGYFIVVLHKKIQIKDINFAAQVRLESEKIGKMTPAEYRTAAVLILLIILWITASDRFGMGGPVIMCIVLLNILGVLRWRDINRTNLDIVALYASACAMGCGLAATGGALFIANSFISILPDFLKNGEGLAMSASLFTGILTNFMSDGATVAAIGPIAVPMATLSGTPPMMIGLATSFASSFAHMLIIGTPNNAIAYSLAKDPETGEQLVTLKDFLVHGFAVLILSFGVLWIWTFFGYWRWIGF